MHRPVGLLQFPLLLEGILHPLHCNLQTLHSCESSTLALACWFHGSITTGAQKISIVACSNPLVLHQTLHGCTHWFCWAWDHILVAKLLDRSGLPDTAVDYKKALEARKLLSASDLYGNRRHSERTTQITAFDYEKALEARTPLSASDFHGNRRHSERTTQMLTQQCRQQALLAMSA